MHHNVIVSLASKHIAFSVSGESLTRSRHLNARILPLGKWDCRVQRVKFSGDFHFGCFGQKRGLNRYRGNSFTLEQNAFLIGVTKLSCVNTFMESVMIRVVYWNKFAYELRSLTVHDGSL